MGGLDYERDDYSSSSSSSWGSSSGSNSYSNYASSKMQASYLDSLMHPKNKILKSTAKTPIIILLDVTGSNTDFAKIVYDKMPMFYGQIEQQGYLKDFEIAFCAVGDASSEPWGSDKYPLQIGSFAKGIEIDSWLEKIVLEGGGGGQKKESYELAAYYLLKNTEFAKDSKPLVFFLGDEAPYPKVDTYQASEYVDDESEGINPFPALCKKFKDNVFMFLNAYNGRCFEDSITNAWVKNLPAEHVIKINQTEEKSIIDLMLGTIALVSKTRDLDSYKVDMLARGQDKTRISGVTDSLTGLSKALVPIVDVKGIIKNNDSGSSSGKKGKRL